MKTKRTNWEMIESLILDCAKRVEKLKLSDFREKDFSDLHDTSWNATNVTGKFAELITEAENRMVLKDEEIQ